MTVYVPGLYAWTLSWDAGVSSERRDRSCSRNCLRRFRAPRPIRQDSHTERERERERGSERPRSTWWLFTTTSFRLWSPMLPPMYPVTSFRVRLFEMLCWVYAMRPHPNDLRQPTHHNKHTQKSLTCTICQVTILLDPSKTLETKTKRGTATMSDTYQKREREKKNQFERILNQGFSAIAYYSGA